MLPPVDHLARERDLLLRVISKRAESDGRPPVLLPPGSIPGGDGPDDGERSAKIAANERSVRGGGRAGGHALPGGGLLKHLPKEVLTGIAEQYLESPVWHACQLGESSAEMVDIFMDEGLWSKFFDRRFREASESPKWRRQQRSPSPSTRLSYASLHELERRFREGLFEAKGPLQNPHAGVAVLDVRIGFSAGESHTHEAMRLSTLACAALRDGAVVMYDLAPCIPNAALSKPTDHGDAAILSELSSSMMDRGRQVDAGGGSARLPGHAAPLREFSPTSNGGPALCCLPVMQPSMSTSLNDRHPILAAGHALGQLSAWHLLTGKRIASAGWQTAHSRRISALASLCGAHTLLSASADGLVKAWDLGADRFGDPIRSFSSRAETDGRQQAVQGSSSTVASVASSPRDATQFLTGGHDRQVRLWDARQGALAMQWMQSDWATCVDFHPLVPHIAYSSDKRVHEWDMRHLAQPVQSRHRHRKLISRFRLDPLRLASCSLDGTVKVSSMEAPHVRHASPSASPVLGPRAAPDLEGNLGCDARTLCTSADYVLSMDFDAQRLIAGGVNGHVDVYYFSDVTHFRASSPTRPSDDAQQESSPSGPCPSTRLERFESVALSEQETVEIELIGDLD